MRKDVKAAVKTSRQTPKLRTAGQEEGRTPVWGASPRRGCCALTARMGGSPAGALHPTHIWESSGRRRHRVLHHQTSQSRYHRVKEGKKVLNALTCLGGSTLGTNLP